MNLEQSMKDAIAKQLESGIVEQKVAEQLEKGIQSVLSDLFGNWGDLNKIMKEQIKSVMIPYLEGYDYSDYILKLDTVLVEVLKSATIDNKQLLENFKELMVPIEEKEIKISDLFSKWKDYVAKNVKTDDLDIDYDDTPSYEYIEVIMSVEENSERSWALFEHAVVTFECEHDEEMNFQFPISRYKNSRDEGWDINYKTLDDIKSLRQLNEMEILFMKLSQNGSTLVLDTDHETDDVRPEAEPEASFS